MPNTRHLNRVMNDDDIDIFRLDVPSPEAPDERVEGKRASSPDALMP